MMEPTQACTAIVVFSLLIWMASYLSDKETKQRSRVKEHPRRKKDKFRHVMRQIEISNKINDMEARGLTKDDIPTLLHHYQDLKKAHDNHNRQKHFYL